MTYIMQLHEDPFLMVKEGTKTIELRLNDEKRRRIRVGDCITFLNRENSAQTLTARVVARYPCADFEELYANLPLEKCGYTAENVASASARDMDVYYTVEEQKKYGAVGIEIEVIT